MAYEVRLKNDYKKRIIPELMQRFSYTSVMQVPKLEKIVVSRGIGGATQDKKLVDQAVQDFTLITGQKPIITKSKRDISNFKLRIGMPIGCKVTLRRDKMYEFMDRLIHVAIPRMRDFRGLPDGGMDGRGNYTLGIKEQIIFMEIDVDKVYKISGMDVTFVTNSRTDEEAFELLKLMGMPFKSTEKTV